MNLANLIFVNQIKPTLGWTMKKDKGYAAIIVVILIVCIIAFGVILYYSTNGFIGIIYPKDVTISGIVSVAGIGRSPEKITFTSLTNEHTYVQDTAGNSYSISLPNGDSYSVTITYTILLSTGNTDAGTLNLRTLSSSATYNWSG